MHARSRTVPLGLLFWICLALSGGIHAAGAGDTVADWSASSEARLKQLNAVLKGWQEYPPDEKVFAQVQQEVLAMRDRAEACSADHTARLAAVQEKLSTLGEPPSTAAKEVRDGYRQFQQEQQAVERQLAVCRLIELKARDLKDAMAQQRRQMFSRALLVRTAPVWRTLSDVLVNGFADAPARELSFEPWPAIAAGLLLLAMLLPVALMLARALRQQFQLPAPDETAVPLRSTLLAGMYSRRAPVLALLLAVVVTLFIGGAAPVAGIVAALLISAAVAPLVQLAVCHGKLQCPEGLPARLLLDVVIIAGALALFGIAEFLPTEGLLLLRVLFHFVLCAVALWLVHKLIQRKNLETLHSLRLPITIVLLAGPVAHGLGYVNLGQFLTRGVYGTGAGILLAWWLLSLVNRFLGALGDADSETPPRVRQWLGYGQGERVAGLGAMRWLLWLGGLVALGYWLLFSWQVSESDTTAVRDVLTEGFALGAVHVVPVKLVVALLAFLVLLTLARWLRRQLGERWLTRTTLDAGARQSVVALTSYTIVGAAIMLSLSMAGLDFQNVAIVAGALSVGIGFGLQNIVNNFVSGLILLFERPVRPGDWVVVGGTEGYVRRVSIRYTLIQTFDRADVLVPNSELISNQVTNLMLSDTFGRVTVPVGVAYGTDTRKVREILHKIAREHPMAVLHDPRVATPRVFFMGFGESSLDFELRFFIQNIDYKLSVRSDVLFAIDDAFREAGIEIPFPQRVVHMQKATATDVEAPAGEDTPP